MHAKKSFLFTSNILNCTDRRRSQSSGENNQHIEIKILTILLTLVVLISVTAEVETDSTQLLYDCTRALLSKGHMIT